MTTSLSDAVAQTERALLSSILLDNSLWSHTDALTVDDFSSDTHRQIYGQIAVMFEEGRPVDTNLLAADLERANKLDRCGGLGYLGVLFGEPAVAANFPAYVRRIREAARERRYNILCERLVDATETDARLEIVEQMQSLLSGRTNRQDWRTLFHTREEIENAPPLTFAIEGFLQEDGIGACPCRVGCNL